MDSQSKCDFETLKSIEVHHTKTTKVSFQLALINKAPHFGLSRTFFPPKGGDFEFTDPKPQTKGVYLPLTAWEKFVKEGVPLLHQEILRQHQVAAQRRGDSTKSTPTTTITTSGRNSSSAPAAAAAKQEKHQQEEEEEEQEISIQSEVKSQATSAPKSKQSVKRKAQNPNGTFKS